MSAGQTEKLALAFRNLSKTFGGQRALAGVNFDLKSGEVHGLLGQNGSGKSTLIKILAGYHAPDPGSLLFVHGKPVALPLPPGQSHRFGISFVHQNLGLIPSLTVVENLLLGRLADSRAKMLSWQQEAIRARETFHRYGLDLDPGATVAKLSGVERALLAIVRALEEMRAWAPPAGGVLVLDEPTPFLPKRDVDRLFALVRSIVAEGASVIFVSHDVDEVLEITDRATVLRDGRLAGTVETRSTNKAELVRLIVGMDLPPPAHESKTAVGSEPLVEIRGLSGPFIHGLYFTLQRGEILGLTGLLGSGYETVPYLLYGGERAGSGVLRIGENAYELSAFTPAHAIRSGIVLIPGDRANAGVIGSLPVVDNVTMPVLSRVFRPWLLSHHRMREVTRTLGERFDITPNDPLLPLFALSGGNAQKAVLAKWLQTKPRLILLDEPTQGVDVGARLKVFGAIRDVAAKGAAIICASADYEQLATLCDRVLVLSRGRIVAKLSGPDMTKDRIAEQCYRVGEISSEQAAA